MTRISYTGAAIFDGTRLHHGAALIVAGGRVQGIGPPEGDQVELPGGTLAPGFLDLQVNGAGGIAVDGTTDPAALERICTTQARLGATGCLPTLISDSAEATAHVLRAGIAAARARIPGFLGLHLEGPHLDPRRKGAHDARLLRPMSGADLEALVDAAAQLPTLMLTVAPEAATPAQIDALARAGVIVSLGHSDCTDAEAAAAFAAGARAVTHLFNAMSQLSSRAPGLVGAALASDAACGLIADGIHVAPTALRVALAARPEGMFLVSDCMAIAGTEMTEMTLGQRRILRRDGRLTLADGTLAGADLTLPRAIGYLVNEVGLPAPRALAMASATPARIIGRADTLGHLAPGRGADFVHLGPDWSLQGVWRAGQRL